MITSCHVILYSFISHNEFGAFSYNIQIAVGLRVYFLRVWHIVLLPPTRLCLTRRKIVPDMTYNVFGGTLNLALSIYLSYSAFVSLFVCLSSSLSAC